MIVLLLCCILSLAIWRLIQHWRSQPLPPGPRGLPLLGNALQLPTTYTWLAFTNLAKVYGDVLHVSVLGRSFIILSSQKAINDLLDKKGATYSDRPIIPMVGELGGAANYPPMAPYGSYLHREGRKLILGWMNARNAPVQRAMLEAKAARFMTLMSDDPHDVRQHIRWFVASSVIRLTYGIDIENWDHPLIRTVERAMDEFSKMANPGTWLVDSLPILMYVPEWFPGASFQTIARKARERTEGMNNVLYNTVKEQIAQRTGEPTFAAQLIQDHPNPSIEEENLYRRTVATVYLAGTDTTISLLNSFFIVVSNHSAIRFKAQAELDSVVGNARPPDFSDRKHLPYLDAVLQEVHRINPAGPLGLPHKVKEEDYYRGYRIPTGATVLANTWAILHDPAVYPDPDRVDPERYLRPRKDSINPDPRSFAFGFGRRVCPGRMLADDVLFITAANILAQFDLSDAVSLDGSDIKYDGNGIISHPHPWKCRITRREGTSSNPA